MDKRAYGKAYYEANKERILARGKEYRAENREVLAARQRAYYAANRQKACEYKRTKYVENCEALKERQRVYNRTRAGILDAHGETRTGACEICDAVCALVLDHDHATGRVRGWLCNACNKALGGFADNPARLRRAASYIEEKSKCPMQ